MLRKYAKKAVEKLSGNDYQTLNIIELNRQHLLNNFDVFSQTGLYVIPVLKSNAYGHGLEQITQMLNDVECPFLAVDGYFEAAKIRDLTKHNILVLGYILPVNARLLDTKKCSFVVSDLEYLKALGGAGRPAKIHLEINTGMNRMGIQPKELDLYLDELTTHPALELEGVMSHLADADNVKNEKFTDKQVKKFDEAVKRILGAGFKPRFIHIANTAGSVGPRGKYTNTMRLGIGLYGINPVHGTDKRFQDFDKLKPVLELKSMAVKIINLKKGDTVSYGRTFVAPNGMSIAVLPLGYYEGVPIELSNKGYVTYGAHQLPIVGRVCMNHTMIDVSGTDIEVGSEVTVISSDPKKANSIYKLKDQFGLFPYSLMAGGLSSIIRRKIV